MGHRMRSAVFVALVVLMSMGGWSRASQIAPMKLLGGNTDQYLPSVNADWLGWSNNSAQSSNHYNAYARSLVAGMPTGPSMKLNTGATSGFSPDLQTDANVAVFQQVNASRRQSTLFTVDLDTFPLAPAAPPGLNSPDWEWRPTISQSWILFGRGTKTHSGVFLYNRTTHAISTLTNPPYFRNGGTRVYPDDVTETYATWTRCGTTCNVYYYDIASKTTAKVPNPNGTFYYSSSVSDTTDDMYFVRSGDRCGATVKIFRWHIGGPIHFTTVASLPAGYDGGSKTSAFNDGTHDTVTFARLKCAGRYYSDIYQVLSADTARASGRDGKGLVHLPAHLHESDGSVEAPRALVVAGDV